jgi:hypothetical protein
MKKERKKTILRMKLAARNERIQNKSALEREKRT